LLAVWENPVLLIVREVCAYCVAAFVMISGIHYSIVVSRQLHAEGPAPGPSTK